MVAAGGGFGVGGVSCTCGSGPSRRPQTGSLQHRSGVGSQSNRSSGQPTLQQDGGQAVAAATVQGGGRPNPANGHAGYNGAYNLTLDTAQPPKELLAAALRALQANKVNVVQTSTFVLRCERYALEFDAEVAAVDAAQVRFICRLQLVCGDAWLFRELCNRILPAIQLDGIVPDASA